MSITPPSDIVLDAVRAADPVRLQAGLLKLSQGSGAPSFDTALAESTNAGSGPIRLGALGERMGSIVSGAGPVTPAKAHQKLEAFLLQTMIGAMLPKTAAAAFGKQPAGGSLASDVFRSMLAEQLGSGMAKAGGIGVARVLGLRAATPTSEG